jgi:hypothetical protein
MRPCNSAAFCGFLLASAVTTARNRSKEGSMSDRNPDGPTREQVIEPPAGHHAAPMPERPIGTTAVRQGATVGHVRWVLLISLVLVIVGFILAYVLVV